MDELRATLFPDTGGEYSDAELLRLVEMMPVRERYVLKRFYGLTGAPRETDGVIAQAFGFSKSRIWQIRHESVRRMRMAAFEGPGPARSRLPLP